MLADVACSERVCSFTSKCQVKGGVFIVHHVHEGKHQYAVENVVKYKNTTGEKMFARRGDELVQINNMDVQDFTPEELAKMLAEGNPMLKVHKASRMKDRNEQPSVDEDTLYPVSKESMILSFSMEMKREDENEVGEGEGDGDIVEDVCQAGNEENADGLLVVAMKRTTISVVRGRGCDTESPCEGCHGIGCSFDDVVMVAESSTVTLVPRGSGSFRKDKHEKVNVSIEHVATHRYLRGLCSERTIYASPNPEKMTIYYYRATNLDFKGMPVVLNFTGSNCFLRCCKDGGTVLLNVETCEKHRLKKISRTDPSALSFVFYMDSDRSNHLKFESALHRGWFIQILNTESAVTMETLDGGSEEHSFLFIIQK
uniref:Interleukin-1 beta n=1 Tax=Lates calcarifer TaxID=8187 RepID=A0A4W6CJV9_LATCA